MTRVRIAFVRCRCAEMSATLIAGASVVGTFYCRKSLENSREIDVEIHYHVEPEDGKMEERPPTTVQLFKVR